MGRRKLAWGELSLLRVAGKKKASDPFTRKDWYDIKAPTSFVVRSVGKTLVTRTTGTKVSGGRREEGAYI